MPTHERAAFVRRALDSLRAQTLRDLQLFAVVRPVALCKPSGLAQPLRCGSS